MDAQSLNRMLELAIRDLASRQPALSREEHRRDAFEDRALLERSLGLHPQPPRTPLQAQSLGTTEFDGYRIERLIYHSSPDLPVPALLYLRSSSTLSLATTVRRPAGLRRAASALPSMASPPS
jgi:hypothetical protein